MQPKNILMVLNNVCKRKIKTIVILAITVCCVIFFCNNSNSDLLSNEYATLASSAVASTITQNNEQTKNNTEGLNWQKLLDIGVRCSGGIPPDILLAIILTESGGNPYAININGVKSFQPKTAQEALKVIYKYNNANVDIGLMQVNYKTWAKVFNVLPSHLLVPEINICIGSQILRHYLDQHNWSWKGIGRYNATTEWKQANYAVKVSNKLKKIRQWWATQK